MPRFRLILMVVALVVTGRAASRWFEGGAWCCRALLGKLY
jgi:hypothetical protein